MAVRQHRCCDRCRTRASQYRRKTMVEVFGATSTTEDVLSGVNLQGERILVTGVSAGIGVETARALAAHGAQVVGAARDLTKAEAATAKVLEDAAENGGSFDLVELDLADLKSVRACADRLLVKGEGFDVVLANAGVTATPDRRGRSHQGSSLRTFASSWRRSHCRHAHDCCRCFVQVGSAVSSRAQAERTLGEKPPALPPSTTWRLCTTACNTSSFCCYYSHCPDSGRLCRLRHRSSSSAPVCCQDERSA